MSEMKHTPGPWSYEGPAHTIVVYGPEPEQRVCFMTSDGPTKANARLIAAAPDLLQMLKMAQLWLDVDGRFDMQGINAAIAKAEGR